MDYKEKYEKLHRFVKDLYPHMSEYCKEKVEGYIPELKESEDEKIRKELIDFVRSRLVGFPQSEKYIAWLEKQGETFTKKDVDNAYLKGICDAKHELEKQGQVKESDIPQQEEKTCKENDNSLTSEQRVEEAMRELEEKSVAYMEAHKGETADEFIARCRGEQNPSWSEEDEEKFNRTLFYVKNPRQGVLKDTMLVEWLKSIKDRVQPQPKQEWSNMDKSHCQMLQKII